MKIFEEYEKFGFGKNCSSEQIEFAKIQFTKMLSGISQGRDTAVKFKTVIDRYSNDLTKLSELQSKEFDILFKQTSTHMHRIMSAGIKYIEKLYQTATRAELFINALDTAQKVPGDDCLQCKHHCFKSSKRMLSTKNHGHIQPLDKSFLK